MRFRIPHWKWLLLPTILLLTVAVGLPFAIPVYRQYSAIREIERLGGAVDAGDGGPEWLREWIGDERMRVCDDVLSVYLSNTQITDAGLDHVKAFKSLEALYVAETQVTDSGLERLESLTNLEQVALAGTKITDKGLDHLHRLTKLREVDLEGCSQITDAGVERMKELTALPTATASPGVEQTPRAAGGSRTETLARVGIDPLYLMAGW